MTEDTKDTPKKAAQAIVDLLAGDAIKKTAGTFESDFLVGKHLDYYTLERHPELGIGNTLRDAQRTAELFLKNDGTFGLRDAVRKFEQIEDEISQKFLTDENYDKWEKRNQTFMHKAMQERSMEIASHEELGKLFELQRSEDPIATIPALQGRIARFLNCARQQLQREQGLR